MNRIQKELLAIKKSAGFYLRFRKNPEDYANNWMLKRKGKDYIDWYYNYRPALRQFQNKFLGEDCFIIGNGPSLNKMDLSPLNDYYTFGLNKIYLLFERSRFRPKFHVSVNSHVIEQSREVFAQMNIPSFISFNNSSEVIPSDHIQYLYTIGGVNKFNGDISTAINEGGTVTYVAMQIAYFMGFQNVYLIGVDHNFHQKGQANEEQTMTGEDKNHFDPNYFKGMKWNLADLRSSEYGYHLANLHYNYYNRRIFNATVGGKLEIFERLDFDTALAQAKPTKKLH
jgi:hypothetical protein